MVVKAWHCYVTALRCPLSCSIALPHEWRKARVSTDLFVPPHSPGLYTCSERLCSAPVIALPLAAHCCANYSAVHPTSLRAVDPQSTVLLAHVLEAVQCPAPHTRRISTMQRSATRCASGALVASGSPAAAARPSGAAPMRSRAKVPPVDPFARRPGLTHNTPPPAPARSPRSTRACSALPTPAPGPATAPEVARAAAAAGAPAGGAGGSGEGTERAKGARSEGSSSTSGLQGSGRARAAAAASSSAPAGGGYSGK